MNPVLLIIIGLGVAAVLGWFLLAGDSDAERRMKKVAGEKSSNKIFDIRTALFGADETRDLRRRQIQESVQQIEERAAKTKRRRSLEDLVDLAGLAIPPRHIQFVGAGAGILLGGTGWLFAGLPLLIAVLIVGLCTVIVPRLFLGYLINRRKRRFMELFPDAIDIMVRAIRTGLPVNDALRMIATESPAPVGPEFLELVEAQRLGLTVESALDRMCERVAIPEINFLAIVMNIQARSGGNLSEALANLSRVLRERKKMRGKIAAVSQEAISSASIIGAMPVLIVGLLMLINPEYLIPLLETKLGNIILGGCLIWMGIGVLVMRGMIKMDI
jgi:tight adherence protein B